MQPLVPFVRNLDWGPHDALVDALRAAMPDLDLQIHAEIPIDRLGEPTVAIVDGPSSEQLSSMPNLRLVQSTWAGVEAILPAVPDGVDVARMVDPQLGLTMAEAVLAWTLYLHRDMPRYARQQRRSEWIEHAPVRASKRRVGILGLGALGCIAAETLRDQRFDVAGWSRTKKTIDGVECFHDGPRGGGLDALLERSDIVVNLLPHTDATVGLLGADAFARMPAGASLINFGRGSTVDDDALLAALGEAELGEAELGEAELGEAEHGEAENGGHLGHAVLDVFDTEPLPDDHPYWDHPKVTVLPHISGPTSTDTAAVIAAANVRAFLADGTRPTEALVDRTRGY
jgi:glyoxylate/hydroxypyruvate reductase A